MAASVVAVTGAPAYQDTLRQVFERHPVYLLSGERSHAGWNVPDWAWRCLLYTSQFAAVQARIVAWVAQASDAALYGSPWYEKYTQGRMIQLNTSSPYANARGRLRKWKRANGLA